MDTPLRPNFLKTGFSSRIIRISDGYEPEEREDKMKEKMLQLISKYCDILVYLIFGVLTTIVNYVVYLPAYNLLHISAAVSNMIAWVAAVIFAYVTNKPFVFQSHDWSKETVIPELTKFVSCRVGSGVLETAILFVTVDLLGWNGNIWKLATAVIVIVINYIASKFFVFQK